VALAMNPPMQVSSSNSLISLAMTVLPQEWRRQNHNWEQELWFRDDVRTYTGGVDARTDTRLRGLGRGGDGAFAERWRGGSDAGQGQFAVSRLRGGSESRRNAPSASFDGIAAVLLCGAPQNDLMSPPRAEKHRSDRPGWRRNTRLPPGSCQSITGARMRRLFPKAQVEGLVTPC
jgi:hypothetical protein